MSFLTYTQLSTVCCYLMHKVIRVFNIMIILFFIFSCSHHQSAPISSRQPPVVTQVKSHAVKAGETLYSIAWQYNLDYPYLAAINGIDSNFLIYPGQRLILKPSQKTPLVNSRQVSPASQSARSVQSEPPRKPTIPSTKSTPPTIQKRSNKTSAPIAQSRVKAADFLQLSWQWPAKGKVVTNFYNGSARGKGIDITGKKGESIFAAAPGKIVYAGNGIRGYGNLVIIRHNAQYLSAYAHNHKINVKEGEQVTGGQRIAELGSTGVGAKNRTILHFQVRKNGKPIDPMNILPKRNF